MDQSRTLHRRQAHDTEIEAARSIVPHCTRLQKEIMDWAKEYAPFSDEKLAKHFGHSATYRTRRAELVHMGLIADSGKRIKTLSGRKAILWDLTEKAKSNAR